MGNREIIGGYVDMIARSIPSTRYYMRRDRGADEWGEFLRKNPEFDTPGFRGFSVKHNRAMRDSGELHELAKHEVLRLAHEWEIKSAVRLPVMP